MARQSKQSFATWVKHQAHLLAADIPAEGPLVGAVAQGSSAKVAANLQVAAVFEFAAILQVAATLQVVAKLTVALQAADQLKVVGGGGGPATDDLLVDGGGSAMATNFLAKLPQLAGQHNVAADPKAPSRSVVAMLQTAASSSSLRGSASGRGSWWSQAETDSPWAMPPVADGGSSSSKLITIGGGVILGDDSFLTCWSLSNTTSQRSARSRLNSFC